MGRLPGSHTHCLAACDADALKDEFPSMRRRIHTTGRHCSMCLSASPSRVAKAPAPHYTCGSHSLFASCNKSRRLLTLWLMVRFGSVHGTQPSTPSWPSTLMSLFPSLASCGQWQRANCLIVSDRLRQVRSVRMKLCLYESRTGDQGLSPLQDAQLYRVWTAERRAQLVIPLSLLCSCPRLDKFRPHSTVVLVGSQVATGATGST